MSQTSGWWCEEYGSERVSDEESTQGDYEEDWARGIVHAPRKAAKGNDKRGMPGAPPFSPTSAKKLENKSRQKDHGASNNEARSNSGNNGSNTREHQPEKATKANVSTSAARKK